MLKRFCFTKLFAFSIKKRCPRPQSLEIWSDKYTCKHMIFTQEPTKILSGTSRPLVTGLSGADHYRYTPHAQRRKLRRSDPGRADFWARDWGERTITVHPPTHKGGNYEVIQFYKNPCKNYINLSWFPFVSARSYQILQKTWFFSIVVKGISRYKFFLYFFSKLFISWKP